MNKKMSKEALHVELALAMRKEQDEYHNWLMSQDVATVIAMQKNALCVKISCCQWNILILTKELWKSCLNPASRLLLCVKCF